MVAGLRRNGVLGGHAMGFKAHCPKSGYSIDMLVHFYGSSLGRAMVFDGPSHFLASGAPTGATEGRQQRRLRPLEEHEATQPRRCDASTEREKVFIGSFSNIYTAADSPAKLWLVMCVFVCECVCLFGHAQFIVNKL